MKKYWLNSSLSLICVSAVFNVSSAEEIASGGIRAEITSIELAGLKEKINQAIIKVENTNRKLWSYNVSRYENEEGDISSSIEQYSPHSNQKWSLKRINGKAPTQKQLKKFAKKKKSNAKKKDEKQGENIQLPLRKLINQQSLSLISNDEKHLVMAFNVYLKKLGEDSVGKLQGQLTYHKKQAFIDQITVWNNADFSPMFSANITDFTITFSFLQINNSVLSKQNEMKMKGSFAYFTEINETSKDNFSNYTYQSKEMDSNISH